VKKILFLITVLLAFSYAGISQTVFSQTASNPSGTITNTGIDTLNLTLNKTYPNTTVTFSLTRTSGTVAGTATLAGSQDGSAYHTIGSAYTLVNGATDKTYWAFTSQWKYLRIIVGGGTTVVATAAAKLMVAQ
jgi:hypothetical protein